MLLNLIILIPGLFILIPGGDFFGITALIGVIPVKPYSIRIDWTMAMIYVGRQKNGENIRCGFALYLFFLHL